MLQDEEGQPSPPDVAEEKSVPAIIDFSITPPSAPPAAPAAVAIKPGPWSWVSSNGVDWWPAYKAADGQPAMADGWTNAVDWPNHDQPIRHVRPMEQPQG